MHPSPRPRKAIERKKQEQQRLPQKNMLAAPRATGSLVTAAIPRGHQAMPMPGGGIVE